MAKPFEISAVLQRGTLRLNQGDDYGALEQVLRRRYARVRQGEVPMPDVLFIDGGPGQLARAIAVMQELEIPGSRLVAVAKGQDRKPGRESLYLPDRTDPLRLPPSSPALHLIQQLGDEAHRFAITGHRARRHKARTRSPLEDIAGLGAAVLGELADRTSIELVYHVCSFLPAIGVLGFWLPKIERHTSTGINVLPSPAGGVAR